MSARSRSVQRWVKRGVVIVAFLAVGSIVGVLTIAPRPAEVDPVAVVVAEEAGMRRGIDAYAARYEGLAQRYAASGEGLSRSLNAYATRYTGLAEHYAGKGHSSQRGMKAYGDRYAAMAEHYALGGK